MFASSLKTAATRCSSAGARSSRPAVASIARRAFADDAHRPLIQLHGIQARYANATYVAASKANQLETIESELLGLKATADSSKQFANFLKDPLISRNDKATYVSGLDKLSEITRNLLVTMAGNARLNELPKVATTFEQLMKAKRGEVDAKIITAEPLNAAGLKTVQAAMSGQVPKGKTVVIEAVVDPTIVGGLQVQIGDQFLDLSVKSRIDEIAAMPLN